MEQTFVYHQGAMFCEEVDLAEIAAKIGTPCYVYSGRAILDRFQAYDSALQGIAHRVCYAVKANGNLSILRLLAGAGAGFDIVSGGELSVSSGPAARPPASSFQASGKPALKSSRLWKKASSASTASPRLKSPSSTLSPAASANAPPSPSESIRTSMPPRTPTSPRD